MDAESLKAMLSTPVSLFILMLFGSLLSIIKQLVDGRANGSTITFAEYFFKAETVIMIGSNILAFIGLVMTDTLNWTGAIAIGYALNSLADLKKEGRSAAIIDAVPNSK